MENHEITFSNDELVRALLEAQQSGAEDDATAMTTRELVDLLRINDKAVRRRLGHLIERGIVEHVLVPRKGINGRLQSTDAYRLKKE